MGAPFECQHIYTKIVSCFKGKHFPEELLYGAIKYSVGSKMTVLFNGSSVINSLLLKNHKNQSSAGAVTKQLNM
jgi:hypothetical protein